MGGAVTLDSMSEKIQDEHGPVGKWPRIRLPQAWINLIEKHTDEPDLDEYVAQLVKKDLIRRGAKQFPQSPKEIKDERRKARRRKPPGA